MNFDVYGYSAIGTNAENQDNWTSGPMGENGIYAMLADGLGGHGGGKQASQTALQTMLMCLDGKMLPSTEDIARWIAKANDNIVKQQKVANQMKTTLVCLYLENNKAVWAHVGDSRLYHYYNGKLEHYTKDHSVCQLAVRMGEITRNEIPGHKDRNKLIKVLGDASCSPEVRSEITLDKGQHAFLLCSDGLWERLVEDEIMLDLCKSDTAEQWVNFLRKRAEKRLCKYVDNNTAVAVIVNI